MASLEEPKEKTMKAWRTYRRMFREVVPVGEEVATAAVRQGEASSGRLPLTDALIAACAHLTRSRLLHADPHFERIPKNLLKQERLRD
jgi:predicted nucleic acid-binding protein